MDASPVHTHLLKRHRQTILDSEEEGEVSQRPLEALEQEMIMEDIHCASSNPVCSNVGPNPGTTSGTDAEEETIINMHGEERDSPWDSEVDGQDSDTSTPAYKRGKHQVSKDVTDEEAVSLILQEGLHFELLESTSAYKREKHQSPKEITDEEAARRILQEGLHFALPRWVTQRRVNKSILILADSQLEFWPNHDNVCQVELHRSWLVNRWTQVIHTGQLRVECHTVIVYLEAVKRWQDMPPMKNVLQALCKNIRNHGNNPRIFISNHLPGIHGSPLKGQVVLSNFTLQQATRSIGCAMGRSF